MITGNEGAALDGQETFSLIASHTLKGTSVYRPNGDWAGEIEQVMIDKLTGKSVYAVVIFTFPRKETVASWIKGFVRAFVKASLGTLDVYYPLPWSLLTYNTALERYEINVSEQQLKGAPKYSKRPGWDWSNPARCKQIDDYYGVAP